MITEQINKLKKGKVIIPRNKTRELKINTEMNINEISEIISTRLLSKLENTFANNVYKK